MEPSLLYQLYPPPNQNKHSLIYWPDENGVSKPCVSVQLTRGVCALVDVVDWQVLRQYKWSASKTPTAWYMVGSTLAGNVFAHVLVAMLADFEHADVVDHITHHPRALGLIDNRRCNLRPATFSENNENRRTFKGEYKVEIVNEHGKALFLGYYNDAGAADKARQVGIQWVETRRKLAEKAE